MYYLAIDIGASSGRHIVGWLENGEVKTQEVFRFKNGIEDKDGSLVWNVSALFKNIVVGIKEAFKKYAITSLSIDTWGVDYVLLNGDKEVLPVYAYRDGRTQAPIEELHKIITKEQLYAITGIQFQPYNTIYQIYADKLAGRLDGATDALLMPDYFIYKLTGKKVCEYTEASTTGLLNAKLHDFDKDVLNTLGIPSTFFKTPQMPGTIVGDLSEEIQREVGGNCKVVLCASHDTASAVEGMNIPNSKVFISSGTWSLLGIKQKDPITTKESMDIGYTNEGGVGCITYLKNIMGMWIINRLRDDLCEGKDFNAIESGAAKSDYPYIVDVESTDFLAPKSMKQAFDDNLEIKPTTIDDYFKCAYLSLATCYKKSLEKLSSLTGEKYNEIYISGGGAKNVFLNKLVEELCGVKVIAIPLEATAIGNILVQSKVKY